MAWIARTLNEDELIFDKHPYKRDGYWYHPNGLGGNTIKLPDGTIKKIIGRELTWKDEPIEI